MKLPSVVPGRPIQQMRSIAQPGRRLSSVLLAAFLALAVTAYVHAQTPPQDTPQQRMRRPDKFSVLPPTAPTTLATQPVAVATTPAPNTLPTPIAASPVSGEQPSSRARRAVVTYVNGELDVRAADSSLNQILRAISRETGLKITGGVQDQRVFGNYGPASTSTVLATLLDGTGTNILLLEGDATTPPQLTLTPRGGGATPPNPNAPGFDDGPEPEPAPIQQVVQQPARQQPIQQQPLQQQAPQQPGVSNQPTTTSLGPQSIPQPDNNINGSPLNTSPTASNFPTTNSVPTDTLPTPSTTPATSGIVDAPNPPAPGSTTGTAPASPVTPEQIYQQILQQQRQQQRTATPATPVEQPQ